MAKTEVRSDKLSTPVGVYSQATKVPLKGHAVYVSGLTSRGPDGSVVGVGDVRLQTETVLQNLTGILAAAGGTLDDVVKVTVFIRSMADFAAIHAVRQRFFKPPYPASSMVEVSRMVSPDSLIEIEAVAYVD